MADKIEVTVTFHQDGTAHARTFQMDPEDFELAERLDVLSDMSGGTVKEIKKIGHPHVRISGSYLGLSFKHEDVSSGGDEQS